MQEINFLQKIYANYALNKLRYKAIDHFNYYYNLFSKTFELVASKILETVDKMNIEPTSKIITVISNILKVLSMSASRNYLLMLTSPKTFNQTDNS